MIFSFLYWQHQGYLKAWAQILWDQYWVDDIWHQQLFLYRSPCSLCQTLEIWSQWIHQTSKIVLFYNMECEIWQRFHLPHPCHRYTYCWILQYNHQYWTVKRLYQWTIPWLLIFLRLYCIEHWLICVCYNSSCCLYSSMLILCSFNDRCW